MRAGYQWGHHVIRGLELPVPPPPHTPFPATLPLHPEESGRRLSSVTKGNGVTNHTYVIMGSESFRVGEHIEIWAEQQGNFMLFLHTLPYVFLPFGCS